MRLEGSQVFPTPLLPMYKVELTNSTSYDYEKEPFRKVGDSARNGYERVCRRRIPFFR